jgi:hypothetical protein
MPCNARSPLLYRFPYPHDKIESKTEIIPKDNQNGENSKSRFKRRFYLVSSWFLVKDGLLPLYEQLTYKRATQLRILQEIRAPNPIFASSPSSHSYDASQGKQTLRWAWGGRHNFILLLLATASIATRARRCCAIAVHRPPVTPTAWDHRGKDPRLVSPP